MIDWNNSSLDEIEYMGIKAIFIIQRFLLLKYYLTNINHIRTLIISLSFQLSFFGLSQKHPQVIQETRHF